MGGGYRRVAAQGHLDGWREPAQVKVGLGIVVADEKRRLRKAVLQRDGLQGGVGKPRIQRNDRRRVAAEHMIRKRIHLKEAKSH